MSETLITVHALALLACPVVAVAAVVVAPRAAGQKPAGIWALVWPVLIAVVPAMSRHMCDEGQALKQWLIPLCSLWLVAVGVGHIVTRRCVAMVLAIAMWLLTYHFDRVVHDPDVTGNPNCGRAQKALSSSNLRVITAELANSAIADSTEYAAGWVRDLPFASRVESPLSRGPIRGEVAKFWHTPWTGFYRLVRISQDFWFPGGSLATSADRIELRDRPDATWGYDE